MDWVLMAFLVGSFALLATVHCALALALTLKPPRWRGPFALLVPPLAPYWGYQAGLKGRAALWLAALLIYALSLVGAYAAGGQ